MILKMRIFLMPINVHHPITDTGLVLFVFETMTFFTLEDLKDEQK